MRGIIPGEIGYILGAVVVILLWLLLCNVTVFALCFHYGMKGTCAG